MPATRTRPPTIPTEEFDLDRWIRELLNRHAAVGFAIGVVRDGRMAAFGAHGLADIEAATPITQDTVFRIASMTKSFTAMAILKLRDEGKLSLDDAVSRYVPALANLPHPTKDSPEITIRASLCDLKSRQSAGLAVVSLESVKNSAAPTGRGRHSEHAGFCARIG